MNLVTLLYYFFMVLCGVAAGAILFSKNVFKSALYLLTSVLSIGALYVLSLAEFLAVAQVLVYAGGILVIIIFRIMMTTKISGRPLRVTNTNLFGGLIAGVGFFTLIAVNLPSVGRPLQTSLEPVDVSRFGFILFSEYVLPFELAGILLLMALVGAAVTTSHLKSRS